MDLTAYLTLLARHGGSDLYLSTGAPPCAKFNGTLKHLRQAPDVIQIGEIRDQETMEHVLNYAETGHLVVSTLHANNANQAIDRILNFFPESRHPQILQELKETMEKSRNNGMQTFDQALFLLVQDGLIDADVALRNADSANNLRVQMKLSGRAAPGGMDDVTLSDM